MPPRPITRDLVIRTLKDHGPLTGTQIAEKAGIARFSVSAGLRHARAAEPKLVRICGYSRNIIVRGRIAPIYALGSGQDASPPIIDPQDNKRRYRQKNRAKIRLSDELRRNGAINPFSQLKNLCRSAPKKQRSARA